MMKLPPLQRIFVVLLATAGLLAASAPASAKPDPGGLTVMDGGCGAWLENPHYSGGAGGVIVKTRYSCDLGFTMTVTGALSYLYYCGNNQPTGSLESGWTNSQGCQPVRSSNYSSFAVGSNQTVTRYTPDVGRVRLPVQGLVHRMHPVLPHGRHGLNPRLESASVRQLVTWSHGPGT